MLEHVLPNPKHRRVVYRVFAAVGLILGGWQIVVASTGAVQPVELTAAMAVYGFLGGAGFSISSANTPKTTETKEEA